VLDTAGDVRVRRDQNSADEVSAGVVDRTHQATDVLAVLGKTQLDPAGGRQFVDAPPVHRTSDVGGEFTEMPAAIVPRVPVTRPGARSEIMEYLDQIVEGVGRVAMKRR
jgi:hypothetical protein